MSRTHTYTNEAKRILLWNANGLLNRKNELSQFMQDENIDIALITETHLTSRIKAEIRGYKLYCCNHPQDEAHGGAAIYIKSNLKHHESADYATKHIQAACITIELTNGTKCVVAALYSPPRHRITTGDYLAFFQRLGDRWLVGGDYNAKHPAWGSRLTTPKGSALYKGITEIGASSLSNGHPTYWPTDPQKTPDCIDFFVHKGVAGNFLEIENISDLSSDHSPIILTLSSSVIRKQALPKLTTKYTNWEKFREEVNSRINLRTRLKTHEDIDLATQNFTKIITESAEIATPKPVKNQSSQCYPIEVRKAITARRKARHLWEATRDPIHKAAFNKCSKEVKRLLQKIKNETFTTFLLSLDTTRDTNYSLWKVAKAMKKHPSYTPPLRSSHTTWARNDLDKAKVFANHLENTFKPNAIPTDVTPVITKNAGNKIRQTSPSEIQKAIEKLKQHKAPGLDQITAKILREMPKKAYVMLTYIYNAILRTGHFPQPWKTAKIIMLPKPGKQLDIPKSYRPISLLTTISKLFEKIYYRRLLEITNEMKIIPDHQFGFRGKHAAIEQIHRVTNTIRTAFENKEYCPAVFLDVSEAFDRVWVQGLLHKISQYLPEHHVKLIQSYLTDRKFQVHQGDEKSEEKQTEAGVPQGSVLGPLLYLLFTADIPVNPETQVLTFADDTAILAAHENYDQANNNLQKALDSITDWTAKWKILLNTNKSIKVDFALRPHNYIPVYIKGEPIPASDKTKYLGLTIDKRLSWRAHIETKNTELKLRFRSLFWLLRAKNKLSLYNKKLLYTTVIRPIWTYGAPVWGYCADSNIAILQRRQNIMLRKMIGAPFYVQNKTIHDDLGIDPVVSVIRRLTESYEKRLHNHTNILAIQLLEEPQIRRLQRRMPFDVV